MPARLLVVGLDAMEATLIDDGVARGDLPAFRALTESAADVRLANPMSTLPGAIWPELSTGRSAATVGLFFHPDQLHSGESVPRPVEAGELDPRQDWWQIAGEADRRFLVVDAPQTVPRPGANGVQLADWGTHDRTWEPVSEPPAALADAGSLVGRHPIHSCDEAVRGGGPDAYRALLRCLLESVEQRTRLVEDHLRREAWDVAHVVFSESHCVGHQFWVFRAPGPFAPMPPGAEDLGDAVDAVYRAIDAGVGRLVAAAGPDADVVVVASHGMGPYVGGYQLLPEVLVRLGLRPRANPTLAALPSRVPPWIRSTVRRTLPARLRWRVLALAGSVPHHDLQSARTKATVVPNNRCGAIRLNLRGREPDGCVEPGAESRELVELLRRELAALTDPRSGERIVASVDAHLGRDGAPVDTWHPDLPDVTVAFRTDLGPLESCTSPRVGRVDAPLWSRRRRRNGWPVHIGRTGDHTDESRLWLRSPRFELRDLGGGASVRDLAPTSLALLGVPVPPEVEGESLVRPRS